MISDVVSNGTRKFFYRAKAAISYLFGICVYAFVSCHTDRTQHDANQYTKLFGKYTTSTFQNGNTTGLPFSSSFAASFLVSHTFHSSKQLFLWKYILIITENSNGKKKKKYTYLNAEEKPRCLATRSKTRTSEKKNEKRNHSKQLIIVAGTINNFG